MSHLRLVIRSTKRLRSSAKGLLAGSESGLLGDFNREQTNTWSDANSRYSLRIKLIVRRVRGEVRVGEEYRGRVGSQLMINIYLTYIFYQPIYLRI